MSKHIAKAVCPGDEYEKELSLELHTRHIPVLISSKLLRKYGCSQVDISFIKNKTLYLIEAKSSSLGVLASQKGQALRLWNAASFLESLLEIPTNLKFIAKR